MWSECAPRARFQEVFMEKKLTFRNYFGYGIADLGNNIAFAAVGSYLTLFYSDVLGANFDEKTSARCTTLSAG